MPEATVDAARRVRVLVADDDADVRSALVDALAAAPDLEVVATAEDAEDALRQAAATRPDVVIADVRMPRGGGPRVAAEMPQASPGTKVLALSAYSSRDVLVDMLRAGAIGYVVKGGSAAEVRTAVRHAAKGLGTVSDEVTPTLVSELVESLGHSEGQRREAELRTAHVRHALDNGLPRIVFQPIVSLATGAVVGHEALARFDTEPQRPPDVWFSEADTAGLGLELETAALETALETGARILADGFLTLNVSPQSAQSPLLAAMLDDKPIERIVLEITEHVPVLDYDALDASLKPLRGAGLRVAVDDAGAGFASLKHLLRLTPDMIKIDGSITSGIDSDPARRALASGLTAFAREIGALVIGEGIESAAEVAAMQAIGVHLGQGYFLGPPASPAV